MKNYVFDEMCEVVFVVVFVEGVYSDYEVEGDVVVGFGVVVDDVV